MEILGDKKHRKLSHYRSINKPQVLVTPQLHKRNKSMTDLNIERRNLLEMYRIISHSENKKESRRKKSHMSNNEENENKIQMNNQTNGHMPTHMLSDSFPSRKSKFKSLKLITSFDMEQLKDLGTAVDNKKLEKKAISNCMKQMELIPNKEERVNIKTNRLGSLYQLFKSEYFDVHLLVCYLDKKEEPGIIDTLINILHEKYINESFFYIPQLCTMITYKAYYESLENYILDRCVDQMKFSLKVHWLISSYTENAEAKIVKKFDKLIQRIEMTLVNARRATLSSFRMYNALNVKTEEEVYKHSLDKEYRLNYFDKAMRFYHDLKNMCQRLKDFPKENKVDPKNTRNEVMRKYLKKFNKNIKNMYNSLDECHTETTTKAFFRGYILPFDDSNSTMDDFNSLIVNFLPEHSFCFSTKARVPVKITVETIRVLECEFWDELYDNDNNLEEDILKTEENNEDDNQNPHQNPHQNPQQNPFSTNAGNNPLSNFNNPISNNIIEYSSLDDFFKKINKVSSEKEEYNTSRSTQNKEKEIKKIVDNIKKANENEFYSPRLSLLKSKNRESLLSEIQSNNKEESFLYDKSENTVNPFGPKWSDIVKQIKEKSRFKKFETYSVKCFIAKANDDLRQEVMTMQLIKRFDDVFTQAEIPLRLRPYEILITSPSSGLIEFLPNTISIDGLKKNLPPKWNLNIFFRKFFTNNFEEAQKNFAESLAAHSLVMYIINIKDRHNGNILLDMNGHIIHIDFGFILGISPGNLNFENAPFKLTNEYMDIMDGPDSNIFHYFKSLILRGIMELRKHVDSFVEIVDVMARGSKMPCFNNNDTTLIINRFIERFHMNKSEIEYVKLVDELINNSMNNWRTVQYDNFQKLTNDIRP